MLYHYLYKICCKQNDLVYWGVHSTTNLEDGYMGSGVALSKAKEQYGESNFYKIIMAFSDTREKVLELEQLVVAGFRGNCLNKINGGGGIRKLYTDKSEELPLVDCGDTLEGFLCSLSGVYDVASVEKLIALDIRLPKPTQKALRKQLNAFVKAGRLERRGKNYFFPLKEL